MSTPAYRYPTHLEVWRFHSQPADAVNVTCLVCGRTTGLRSQRRGVRAVFLRRHRRCGVLAGDCYPWAPTRAHA